MNASFPGHSRSTGTPNPWLVENMREGETYGSWVWAAESPRGATDQDGRVPKSAAQSSVGLKYLYASRPWSPVAEAYHNRARWYSPEAARFLTRDPISYLGGVNQYMYAGGNPIGFRDPWGLLQMDKEGNPIVDGYGQVIDAKAKDPDGQMQTAYLIEVYLLDNNGDRITAYRPVDPNTPAGWNTNCHGMTFANGQYWINPDQAERILITEGYQKAEYNPFREQIVVFRHPTFGILHSETVKWDGSTGGPVGWGLDTLESEPYDSPLPRNYHGVPPTFYNKPSPLNNME